MNSVPKEKNKKESITDDENMTPNLKTTEKTLGAKQTRFEKPENPGNQFSDDENEKRNAKLNRMSKRRFGHVVKFEKYKTSNLIKIICITLGIIIIPLEIFVQNVL